MRSFWFICVCLKCSYFWETISPIQLHFASFCFSDWNCHQIINGADVLRIEVLRQRRLNYKFMMMMMMICSWQPVTYRLIVTTELFVSGTRYIRDSKNGRKIVWNGKKKKPQEFIFRCLGNINQYILFSYVELYSFFSEDVYHTPLH